MPCSTTFSLQHKNSHTHSLSITAEECKNSIVIQTFCINHRNFREFVYFKTISFLVLHCCSIPIEPVYSFSYGHLRQRQMARGRLRTVTTKTPTTSRKMAPILGNLCVASVAWRSSQSGTFYFSKLARSFLSLPD